MLPSKYAEILELAAQVTRERVAKLKPGEVLEPIALMWDGAGRRTSHEGGFGPDDGTDKGKDLFAIHARAKAAAWRAVFLIYIAEAWLVNVHTESEAELDALPMPSEHPDRREVVLFTLEMKGFQELRTAPLTRDVEGRPSMGALVEQEPGGDARGRFVGMLPANWAR